MERRAALQALRKICCRVDKSTGYAKSTARSGRLLQFSYTAREKREEKKKKKKKEIKREKPHVAIM